MKSKKINIIIIAICIIVIGCALGYSRYTDMINNSDVTSFVGSIFGALIGVFGALYVVHIDRKKDKEKSIEKLMEMFKHTYIWLYPRYYIGAYNNINALSQPIVPLIYDENWKEYIIQIDNTHNKRFLLSWFYTLDSLENKNAFIAKVNQNQLDEAIKILKYYNMYDREVKDVEKKAKSEYAKSIKNNILNTKNELDALLEKHSEEQEAWEEEYACELEENISYEDQLDNEITNLITEYDLNVVNNSIYNFN